jgi:hypothetical protein
MASSCVPCNSLCTGQTVKLLVIVFYGNMISFALSSYICDEVTSSLMPMTVANRREIIVAASKPSAVLLTGTLWRRLKHRET